jgi:hypothetical protein
MKLRYLGTGTVLIEGVGEVSAGGIVEVPEAVGRALVAERPGHWALQTSGKGPSKGAGPKS